MHENNQVPWGALSKTQTQSLDCMWRWNCSATAMWGYFLRCRAMMPPWLQFKKTFGWVAVVTNRLDERSQSSRANACTAPPRSSSPFAYH